MQLTESFVLETFASPFVDDDLFASRLGGNKQDAHAVRHYLRLPIPARPDLSWFFDSAYHLQKYPDIQAAAIDPLVHFMRWGAAELRSPHPLIDLRHIREAHPDLLPQTPTIEVVHNLLSRDLVDPSRLFSLDYYRSQLDNTADTSRGLLHHFLRTGMLAGLRPHPGLDLIAAYRLDSARTFDIRSTLRHLALSNHTPTGGNPGSPAGQTREDAAKALFRDRASSLLPTRGRYLLRFNYTGIPDVTVLMVVHNQFALTLQALASLRQAHAGGIQLVLIDSGSTDETRHIASYVTGAEVLRFDDNIGYLRGCNAGLQRASGSTVLYLNNDIELAPGALAAALDRLHSNPHIGAVGGKVIRAHGALQEAGCIIWRDGSTSGYLRDQSPLCPEANFVRDVDFCSAAFLLVRADVVHDCGGFDEAFAPAYYEDADLCLRMQGAGYRIVYDPSVVVYHLEYGSTDAVADVDAQINRAQQIFLHKHVDTLHLRHAVDSRAQIFARSVDKPLGRILFIEDVVPLRRLGAGFGRSNDIVRTLAGMGYQVTIFPVIQRSFDLAAVYADLPDTVEVMADRGLAQLGAFLISRRGAFDTIWIARTHNLDRVKPIIERVGVDVLCGAQVVLDTEAIAATRDAAWHRLQGTDQPFDQSAAVQRELSNAAFCQSIVAVSDREANILLDLDLFGVHVLGFMRELALTPRLWADRNGLLFVGAFGAQDTPNYDSLCWFVDAVLPLIEQALGYETRLTIVGSMAKGVNLDRFRDHPRITLRGEVGDTVPLYNAHRVFIAPTRYAAGLPYKVHEAASYGVPVVATELLRSQLGWQHDRELLAADASDPAAFAAHVVALYRSEALWIRIRNAAAAHIRDAGGREAYERAISYILAT